MLRTAFFGLVATVVLVSALTAQVPLNSTNHQQDGRQSLDIEEWHFDKSPNPNDTDHLIFETVHSLLQYLPNARMRNGHTIVPGRIPKGTLLYHGRTTKEFPSGPEWVTTGPERPYLFCRSLPRHFQSSCWHLTLSTTRPLKVIYFDGSSAVRLSYGSLDTQDLLAWGETHSHNAWDEEQRIQALCKWGKRFGVDGFMRTEMDFEVMLCNFTSGVKIVSFENVAGQWATAPMTSDFVWYEVMNAGSWHNHLRGETRVQLNLAGLVSFYDVQLAPSLIDSRVDQGRWNHRVQGISTEDWLATKSRLEANLVRPEGVSSGIDWKTLIQDVVDRYAGQFESMRHLLDSPVTDTNILDFAYKAQTQLGTMLTPYLLFTAIPTYRLDKGDLNWTTPIYKRCATTHTHSLESELDSMTDSEKLVLRAIRRTTREICRVVTKMWAIGVHAGIGPSSDTRGSPSITDVTHVWNTWAKDLDGLMVWLDWSAWVKCDPGCGPEKTCYLPTWPVGFPPMGDAPSANPDRPIPEKPVSFDFRTIIAERVTDEMLDIIKPESDDWIRPQPRCIRRVGPDDI